MKVTNLGPTFPLIDVTSFVSGGSSGQGLVATGSNGGTEWVDVVQRIYANGSNLLLSPFVNFASGSNITFAVASNTLTISSTGGGAASTLPWFDVTDYGAVGNGSTDDKAAINAAIAAYNAAGGGVLYFPAVAAGAYYYVSGALTALTKPGTVLGDGSGPGTAAASPIACDNATAVLFTVSSNSVTFRGLRLINFAVTPSAGSAIATTTGAGSHCVYEDLWVEGWYDCVAIQYGYEWGMRGCQITNPIRYGLWIANIDIPDGGDWFLSDSWFGTRSRNATSAIRQDSAGGGKLTNVKINCNTAADQTTYGGVKMYVTGYDLNINGVANATAVLTMASCSIENVSGDAVLISTTGTGKFGTFTITGLQVGLYQSNNTGYAVKVSAASAGGISTNGGIGGGTIDGSMFRTTGTARAAVSLTNTDNIVLGDYSLLGFNARYTSSGDTNTTDGGSVSYATPAIVLGSSAAAGAASTVIRSDSTIAAFDATVPSTQAIGDSAATGSAAFAARRDHKHAMPAFGSPVATGTANADGTAVTIARSDHVHSTAVTHVHVAQEEHTSDGSTVTFTLDQAYEPGSVMAFNLTTSVRLSVTEVLPDQATISAAGTAGQTLVFDYAASII